MVGGSLLIFACCAIKYGHQLDSGSVHYRCFCAYVGMHACVCVCVYMHIYVCVCVCVCVCECVCLMYKF